MDQQAQYPLVTRGRILLLALLAACAWLLLSVFTGGAAAVADDSADTDDGILGSLTATVEEVIPVTVVTDTLNEVAEPLEPATSAVTPVIEPLAPVVEPITQAAVDVIEPVLQQPVINTTVTLVSDLVNGSTDVLVDVETTDPLTSVEALPRAAAAYVPGPAAVKATAATPDTRAASVPATGPFSFPGAPAAPAPAMPAPAPAPTLSQTSGAPALIASVEPGGGPQALAVASAASVNFALPTSPTFDNDSSPD